MQFKQLGLIALCISLVATAACGVVADDGIWRQPQPTGKADDLSGLLLDGAEIPSAFVDTAARYLPRRRLDSLQGAGALSEARAALAVRVDGIIANSPQNGLIEAEELVRMEDPDNFDFLFPEEKEELEALWSYLLVPDEIVELPSPGVAALEPEIEIQPPTELDFPTRDILDLATEDQEVARRVQLVADEDGDPTTIDYEDLEVALASPGSFTEAENDALDRIHILFKRIAISNARYLAVLPVGTFEESFDQGDIAFATRVETYAQETWSRTSTRTFRLHREQTVDIELSDPDTTAILVSTDSDAVVAAQLGPVSGFGVVEVWNGTTAVARFVVEGTNLDAVTDFPEDAEYVDADGELLSPRCKEENSGSYTSRWEAGVAAAPCARSVIADPRRLPAGRYPLTGSSSEEISRTIDVYPTGAMFLREIGESDDPSSAGAQGVLRISPHTGSSSFGWHTGSYWIHDNLRDRVDVRAGSVRFSTRLTRRQ